MNSATERSCSSCRIRVVTLDWTRCSRSAARVTLPSRTTALKIIRSDRSIHLSKRSYASQLFILCDYAPRVKIVQSHWLLSPVRENTRVEPNVEGLLDCARLGPGRATIPRIPCRGRPCVSE